MLEDDGGGFATHQGLRLLWGDGGLKLEPHCIVHLSSQHSGSLSGIQDHLLLH